MRLHLLNVQSLIFFFSEAASTDDEPAILKGSYVDYMVDKDLFYKEDWNLNSAIISMSFDPKPEYPLPSEVEIWFNHYRVNTVLCILALMSF